MQIFEGKKGRDLDAIIWYWNMSEIMVVNQLNTLISLDIG